MKFSELNSKVDALRAERDELHESLHELQSDKNITVGEREDKEQAIRGRIKEINGECFPLEVVRGKMTKIVKGQELKPEEMPVFEDCLAQIGEEITIG